MNIKSCIAIALTAIWIAIVIGVAIATVIACVTPPCIILTLLALGVIGFFTKNIVMDAYNKCRNGR